MRSHGMSDLFFSRVPFSVSTVCHAALLGSLVWACLLASGLAGWLPATRREWITPNRCLIGADFHEQRPDVGTFNLTKPARGQFSPALTCADASLSAP